MKIFMNLSMVLILKNKMKFREVREYKGTRLQEHNSREELNGPAEEQLTP